MLFAFISICYCKEQHKIRCVLDSSFSLQFNVEQFQHSNLGGIPSTPGDLLFFISLIFIATIVGVTIVVLNSQTLSL